MTKDEILEKTTWEMVNEMSTYERRNRLYQLQCKSVLTLREEMLMDILNLVLDEDKKIKPL